MLRRTAGNSTAVTSSIGVILIFALVVIAFLQYQNTVVPQQQTEVESQHDQNIRSDLSGLRSGIIQTSNTGDQEVRRIRLGVSYGTPGVNPAPATGSFIMESAGGKIQIENARNDNEADNFWTGQGTGKTYETKFFTYGIDYTRIQTSPIQYEHGILYRNQTRNSLSPEDNKYRLLSSQPLVKGNSITIYTVTGDLQLGTSSEITVRVNPVSAPANPISVTNNSSTTAQKRINITLPSRIPARVWNESILTEQMHRPFGCGLPNNSTTCTDTENHILGIKKSPTGISIILEQNEIYSLRLARVHLTTDARQSRIPETEQQYISWRQSSFINVRPGETIQIRAQARDKYNNGVGGVRVNSEVYFSETQECAGEFDVPAQSPPTRCTNDDNLRQPGRATTNSEGNVVFRYTAPSDSRVEGTDDVNVTVYIPE